MNLDDLVFTVHGPKTALAQLNTVVDLYRAAFEKPPAEMEQGVGWLTDAWPRRTSAPGFRLVIASQDATPVGAIYGHQISGSWWESAVGIPADVTKEWPGRTVAFIDMMVRPAWQRRGVARRMHALQLADRIEERATLLVNPANTRARAAYVKWGYERAGAIEPVAFPGKSYDAMLLDDLGRLDLDSESTG